MLNIGMVLIKNIQAQYKDIPATKSNYDFNMKSLFTESSKNSDKGMALAKNIYNNFSSISNKEEIRNHCGILGEMWYAYINHMIQICFIIINTKENFNN
jgi:hypothetical protein